MTAPQSTATRAAPPSMTYSAAPPPKFHPGHDIPEFFIEELETFFSQRNVGHEERITYMQQIFGKDKELMLWWQRTRLQVSNWEEFTMEFLKMFGTSSHYNSALEKLFNRRQQRNEKFSTFVMEMELQYLKLHHSRVVTVPTTTILSFISERALPWLVPHLLGCNARDIYELIQFAQKIPLPSQAPQAPQHFQNKFQQSSSFNGKPRSDNTNRNTQQASRFGRPPQGKTADRMNCTVETNTQPEQDTTEAQTRYDCTPAPLQEDEEETSKQ